MYRSAARMLWAIYKRRRPWTTVPQRAAVFGALEDVIRADTILSLSARA